MDTGRRLLSQPPGLKPRSCPVDLVPTSEYEGADHDPQTYEESLQPERGRMLRGIRGEVGENDNAT